MVSSFFYTGRRDALSGQNPGPSNKTKIRKVEGELTETIVGNLTDILEICLDITKINNFSPHLREHELIFLSHLESLDFFEENLAKKYSKAYNYLQLSKMNPEDIFPKGIEKLVIDKRFCECYDFLQDSKKIDSVSEYLTKNLVADLVADLSFIQYSSEINPFDEIYLKIVQATHITLPKKAESLKSPYNFLQINLRNEIKSKEKLKQIEFIGSKLGYGISLL